MKRRPELALSVIERRLTYLSLEKIAGLMDAVETLVSRGIPGDLVECGIALGGSAICIASNLTFDRVFYGFDNFAMIPSPEPVDGELPNRRYDSIKSGKSTGIGGDLYYGYESDRLSIVTRSFLQFGLPVDNERIFLIEGLFDQTLPRFLNSPVAFAHIDCDWYSPVKVCLESLYSLLPAGGTIVVDDYNHWEGCTRATDEFCLAHPEIAFTTYSSHATLVRQALGAQI
jgi:O-methyltransferase